MITVLSATHRPGLERYDDPTVLSHMVGRTYASVREAFEDAPMVHGVPVMLYLTVRHTYSWGEVRTHARDI